jgi:holo-[acyl-carrier-protein] synthase
LRDSIIKVGTDIIEIQRFRRRPLKTNMSFYNSIFNKSELMYCLKYSDPYPHLAGIFAAKESVVKCFNKQLRMLDISIDRSKDGKPTVIINCYQNKNFKIEISISHTRSLAVAVAIIIS